MDEKDDNTLLLITLLLSPYWALAFSLVGSCSDLDHSHYNALAPGLSLILASFLPRPLFHSQEPARTPKPILFERDYNAFVTGCWYCATPYSNNAKYHTSQLNRRSRLVAVQFDS